MRAEFATTLIIATMGVSAQGNNGGPPPNPFGPPDFNPNGPPFNGSPGRSPGRPSNEPPNGPSLMSLLMAGRNRVTMNGL